MPSLISAAPRTRAFHISHAPAAQQCTWSASVGAVSVGTPKKPLMASSLGQSSKIGSQHEQALQARQEPQAELRHEAQSPRNISSKEGEEMKMARPICPAEVRALFDYFPETGEVRWKGPKRPMSKKYPGDIAGCVCRNTNGTSRGITISIRCVKFLAHRLIWVWMTGEDIPPGLEIDHRNRNPLDNRWENLRLAEHWQNMRNSVTRNRSLPKGVCAAHKSKGFVAAIRTRDGRKWLGTFDTPQEAAAAFNAAHREIAGEFTVTESASEPA